MKIKFSVLHFRYCNSARLVTSVLGAQRNVRWPLKNKKYECRYFNLTYKFRVCRFCLTISSTTWPQSHNLYDNVIVSPTTCVHCLCRWCPGRQLMLAMLRPGLAQRGHRSTCVPTLAAISASACVTPWYAINVSSMAHHVASPSTHVALGLMPISHSCAITQDAAGAISQLLVCSIISVTSIRPCILPPKHDRLYTATCC